MMSEEVLYEVRDGIAWMTINRPEARNAMNKAVRDGIREKAQAFADDPAAQVLVITAAGDKAFSSGGDLKEMAGTQMQVPPRDFFVYFNRSLSTDKPIIAAVNGLAYAGGFLLAQMCDLVICADHATFAITEARVGRGSPWAAPLAWIVGPRLAMELLTTGQPITAQRAYESGFVNKVVPYADLLAESEKMARTIADNAPLTVRAGKRLVYASATLGFHDMFEEGLRIYEPAYLSEDGLEGPRAFKERRKPVWKAR
jgi:enoyl-CoA hydratase/carnithine racemase